MLRLFEHAGRGTTQGLNEAGYAGSLLGESLFWTFFGRRWRQPVRLSSVLDQMKLGGIDALPITTMLAAAIGIMLAVQSLYTLKIFGAESFVHVGITLAITREFSPLIIGILMAGRSGSALAAKISTMTINQEIDALRAIGINPVRYLVAPSLIAMLVMLPALTMWCNIVAMTAAGLYVSADTGISLAAYAVNSIDVLTPADLLHGLGKSALFSILIVIIGAMNGSLVRGGSEGVGLVTTRAVVHASSAIILTDMFFGFIMTQ
jgi:phospholipid/cholesterol/gamma-HCH transport system permease protein